MKFWKRGARPHEARNLQEPPTRAARGESADPRQRRRRAARWLGISAAMLSPLLLASECNETCVDGMKNGDETDVDCGGPACGSCPTQATCLLPRDCIDGVCAQQPGAEGAPRCSAAACNDHVANGNELREDCGGSSCAPCAIPGCSNAPLCSVEEVPYVAEDLSGDDPYAHADRAVYWADDQVAQFIGGYPRAAIGQACANAGACSIRVRVLGLNPVPEYSLPLKAKVAADFTSKARAIIDLKSLPAPPVSYQVQFELCDPSCHSAISAPLTISQATRSPIAYQPDCNGTQSAFCVPLHVQREQALPLVPENAFWPITTGIPLPEGMAADPTRLRLLADNKILDHAQFTALSRWAAGAGGTLRWVGVDFLARLDQPTQYRIVSVSSASAAPENAIVGTQNANSIEISFGTVHFKFSKTAFAGFEEWADLDEDGTMDPGEQILKPGGGPFAESGGTMYRSVNDQNSVVYVEGPDGRIEDAQFTLPLRATIRAEGSLVNGSGASLGRYVTRISVVPSTSVRIDHQTIITQQTAALGDAGFDVVLAGASSTAKAGMDGTCVNLAVSGQGDSVHQYRGDKVRCLANGAQSNCVWCVTPPGGAPEGTHSDGWIATNTGSFPYLMTVKDFYQRFPQELEVKSDGAGGARLALHQWPKNGLDLDTVKNKPPTFDPVSRKEIHKAWFAHTGDLLNLGPLATAGANSPAAQLKDELIRVNWPATPCGAECPAADMCSLCDGCCPGGSAPPQNCTQCNTALCCGSAPFPDDDNFGCEACAIKTGIEATGVGVALGSHIELAILPPNSPETDLTKRAKLFQIDPHAIADPAWNAATGVLGKLHPKDTPRFPEIESGTQRLYPGWQDFSVGEKQLGRWVYADLHNAWDTRQDAPELYRLYQASHYHNTSAAWLDYFRSGDPEHLEWARANSDTLVNTHINHVPNNQQPAQWPEGYPAGGFDHTKGVLPWAADNSAVGHPADPEALLLSYYLTGDGWSRDAHRMWRGALDEHVPLVSGSGFDRDMASDLGGSLSAYDQDHDPQLIRYFRTKLAKALQSNLGQALTPPIILDRATWHRRWLEYARKQVRDPALDTAILALAQPGKPNLEPALYALAYDIQCNDGQGNCTTAANTYLKVPGFFENIYDESHVYYDNPTSDPVHHGMSLAAHAPNMHFRPGVSHYLRALVDAQGRGVPGMLPNPTVRPGRYPFDNFPAEDGNSVEIKVWYNCSGTPEIKVRCVDCANNAYQLWDSAVPQNPVRSGTLTSAETTIDWTSNCGSGEAGSRFLTFYCQNAGSTPCLIEAPISDVHAEAFVVRPYVNTTSPKVKQHRYENTGRFNFFVGVVNQAQSPPVTLRFVGRSDDKSLPAFIQATAAGNLVRETTVLFNAGRSQDDIVLNNTHPAPWHFYVYSPLGPYLHYIKPTSGPNALYLSPMVAELNAVLAAPGL
jgi:hypothetical protein